MDCTLGIVFSDL